MSLAVAWSMLLAGEKGRPKWRRRGNADAMTSNPLAGTELRYGDEVMIQWGSTEVRGRVAEVYGPKALRRVVVDLEPELSSYVVAEPTNVSLPIADVRKVVPLPRPLTLDAETDALITHGAHLLDMSREAYVADAIHRMAAAQGIEVDQALQAAGEPVVLPTAGSAQKGRSDNPRTRWMT